MADATYGPKVYHKQGGDELTVASGGTINVETGGKITANGTQASAISAPAATAATNSSPYGFSQAQADALITSVRALLVACQGAGIIP